MIDEAVEEPREHGRGRNLAEAGAIRCEAMAEPSVAVIGEKPMKAIRMLLSFDGEHVHVVSQQAVDMVLPPSDPVEGIEGLKGFWYELRDGQNRPLYRRVMPNPMRDDVEVFSDDPTQSVARQATPNRKGVFTVVVPDTEDGNTVTLSSSPRRIQMAHEPATEIARFALQKD
jgi:hypothetical protein